ncbi:hypothetical protein AX16_006601 [Volvariella volvacea WC 439]|nr:hypothetical protein AX16_006601 [Volvariella volvacea WC 439]
MGSTARKFKETFSLDVCIDLVGVWDTVSSVGVFPQILPYSTGNVGIKVFRHALALDEQRARFRPCMWGEPAEVGDGIRELEEPRVKSWPTPKSWSHWSYEPHPAPDVQEVWFTGCHADIGGGSHRDEVSHGQSLSNITLRWMIRECYSANIGISFDNDVLRSYGLFLNELKRPIIIPSGHHDSDPHDVNNDCDTASTIRSVSPANSNDSYYLKTFDSDDDDHSLESSWDESREEGEEKEEEEKRKREEGEKENGGKNNAEEEDEEEGDGEGDDATLKAKATDAMSTIYNQLDNQPWWWFLELIPTVSVQQLQSGKWLRYRRRNLGFGRYIPHASGSVSVHKSVQDRIAGAGLEKGYKPAASNWEEVEGKVKWVD